VVGNYDAPDWFYNGGFALQGMDRINLTIGYTEGGPFNPRFYQTTFDLDSWLGSSNNALVSLGFDMAPGVGATGIYAVSGEALPSAPASILSQPDNVAVTELSPATFSCVVAGVPAPTQQWYRNSVPVAGATNLSCRIPSVSLADDGALFQMTAQNTVSNAVCRSSSTVATLRVLPDLTAPTVSRIIPAVGTTVPSLSQIEIHFSEPVTGVNANQLVVNGVAATNVTAYSPTIYVFDFSPVAPGKIPVSWNLASPITDLSSNSNRLSNPAPFSYTVNPSAVTSFVSISEFMAENTQTIRDDQGQRSDWVEIYNNASQALNLGGWFLTDDPAKLRKWMFPPGTMLPSKSYLLVWASGLDQTNPAAPLHTSFRLSKNAGSYLDLVYSDGVTIVSGFGPYPQQYPDVSYGRDRLDPSLTGYFAKPTPGAANATVGPGFSPEIQFSRASGTFRQPFQLRLSVSGSNSVIRYLLGTNAFSSLAGMVPDESSPIYAGPITIGATMQVRARAFPTQPGYLPGPVAAVTYLQLAPDAIAAASDLPIVVFHNMGAGSDVPAIEDQFITMQVFDTRNGVSSMTNPPDVAVQGYFHRRGQATFWDPKPNLRVETQDPYGDTQDVELLGMPCR
jgi:hypothetical protein